MSWDQERKHERDESSYDSINERRASGSVSRDNSYDRNALERELYGHDDLHGSDGSLDAREPKRRKRFRKGCAVFLAGVMILFVTLIAIGYYFDDYDDEYIYEEFAPDARMDLSMIFSSDDAWHEAFDRLEVLTSDLENKKDLMGSSKEELISTLRLKENLNKLLDKLEVYSNLKSDTDLDDDKAADMAELISGKQAEISERLAFIDEKATEIPLKSLEAWVELPEFAPYKLELEYWIEFYEYGFDEEQDALIAGSHRLSEVPEEIFETFHYLTDIPEIDLDFDDFVSDDPDRREEAYLDLYSKNIIGSELLASALEGEVLANNYLTKMYGYDDAFSMSLEADGIELEDYEAFASETKKGLVQLHRWKQLEKELKGLSDDEKLHTYDYFLDWIGDEFLLEGGIEFDDAKAFVKEALLPLGDEYSETYLSLVDAGIIDILPRESKVDGAYTWGTYDSRPYVLLNYYGDFEDVMTLGHEMGHAVHQELSRKNQSYGSYDASILISEMAATTNEALMFEKVLSNPEAFASETREAILVKYAQSIEETIYSQLLASEFQRIIHEEAEKGVNLDADYLSQLWSDLIHEYYGPAYEVSETDGYGWTEMPHFYWGFYVQKYSIGYTTGISNAVRIIEEPGFADQYLEVLKQGGSELASDQLEAFGYGKSGELAVNAMLERFEAVLDEIEVAVEMYRE